MSNRFRSLLPLFGAVLVLVSTALTGILAYRCDIRAAELRRQLSELTEKYQRSISRATEGNVNVQTAFVTRSVATFGAIQDSGLQKKYGAILGAELYNSALSLHQATGRPLDETSVGVYKRIREAAIAGDDAAIQQLYELCANLIVEAGQYQAALILQGPPLEEELRKSEERSITWKYVAIAFQIVGLLLLLTKEFPERSALVPAAPPVPPVLPAPAPAPPPPVAPRAVVPSVATPSAAAPKAPPPAASVPPSDTAPPAAKASQTDAET